MTSPLIAFLIKLPLALLVFLLVAYAGTVSKRVAGVLLTFPILNGIAIIASDDPVTVADAIYPLVIFNCVLFAIVISFAARAAAGRRAAAPEPAGRARHRLGARVARGRVSDHGLARSTIFGGGILFAGASVYRGSAFMTSALERGSPPARTGRVERHASLTRASRRSGCNSTGLWRIVVVRPRLCAACSGCRAPRSTRNGSAWRARCRCPACSRSRP